MCVLYIGKREKVVIRCDVQKKMNEKYACLKACNECQVVLNNMSVGSSI